MAIKDPLPDRDDKESAQLDTELYEEIPPERNPTAKETIQSVFEDSTSFQQAVDTPKEVDVETSSDEMFSTSQFNISSDIFHDDDAPIPRVLNTLINQQVSDRTTELESRISDLESVHSEKPQLNEEYDPNPSFQSAVKSSLVEGELLKDPDVAHELSSEMSSWEYFDDSTKSKITSSTLRPIHDIIVLTGSVLSGIAFIASLLTGLHLVSIAFLLMCSFLLYSYRTGLGE